jgi:DNA-binding CsgD family transcriptional regulator
MIKSVNLKYRLFYLTFIYIATAFSQELPPILYYSPNQYGAENQNWSISQANNKNIYIANNKGLLEYNGASWQLYTSPNEAIIRSVKVVYDTIYTGSYKDFGFWIKNKQGFLEYTSLVDNLKLKLEEDEQFWNIMEVDDWMVFQSLNNIYILNKTTRSLKKIASTNAITKIYKIENEIYFQRFGDGIYKIENGQDKLVFDDIIFKENVIVNLFRDQGSFIFATQNKGLYFHNGEFYDEWNNKTNRLLSKMTIYNGIRLKDGKWVLGTISNGIVITDNKGDIIHTINQEVGLGNNTILSLFEDLDDNIWLGLDKGINFIEMNGAFSIYKDSHGELGTVYTSIMHDDRLYLGTNQGLFYKDVSSDSHFSLIEGSQGQVWCLKEIDGTLFCGHNLGTFIVNGLQFIEVADVQGTWDIKKIKGRDNMLIQGNYNGLHILEGANNRWKIKHKIEGLDISSRYFEFIDEDEILINHEYKGVFRVKTDSSYQKIRSINREPIEKGLYSSLVKYNDTILYSFKKGIYKYFISEKKFVRDSVLSQAFTDDSFSSGKLVVDRDGVTIWSFNNQELTLISKGKMSEAPVFKKIPLPNSFRDEGVIGFENILKLEENKYLLGTSSGYMIIDQEKLIEKKYHIYINKIKLNSLNNSSIYLDRSVPGEFKNKENNIEFSYNVAEFDTYIDTQYQYRLLGYNDIWGKWSTNHSTTFKNLRYGDFTFQVRSRTGSTNSENVESYSFHIDKPFTLSNVAIAFYIFSGLFLILLIHSLNRRHFKNQRRKVLERTERELEMKELENTKQKISFKNKSLEQDIKNKNRELAISTMSLIKKNEFLNTIKNELKKNQNSDDIKKVINTIDSNLNNTDDWKLFEKAFNNADKDFLKKVKQKHQNLSPNDLRLCTYLRLNLSSKEISPLLNITIRSVEIRRYRLRKKIDLPREVNLNEYFMSL